MVNDQLSDFVTRLRNGYAAGKKKVEIPEVKIVKQAAGVLVKSGYLEGTGSDGGKLVAELKYQARKPALAGIERVSRPGARIYSRAGEIPRVLGGLGICVLSTPKGLMNSRQAKKSGQGGEVLFKVW